jgi:hypothetical protein
MIKISDRVVLLLSCFPIFPIPELVPRFEPAYILIFWFGKSIDLVGALPDRQRLEMLHRDPSWDAFLFF